MIRANSLSFFLLLLSTTYLTGQDPQQGWDFQYPGDTFSSDAALDLSYLNEDLAGDNGFIRRSDDGKHFVNDAGPIRFWAVNGGELVRNHDPNLNSSDLTKYAKFLAKMGVNMIRYHGEMFSTGSDFNSPNRNEAEYIWRVVAAMKKEGIYTTISPLWPAHMDDIPASWGLGDYTGNTVPWGLLYFDQGFRDAYKEWITYLYTTVNTRTGLALKDDPAVGLIQIINEDGVFFWTIGGVQPSLNRMMQEQFFDWAVAHYESIAAAMSEWEQTSLGNDDLAQERLEIIQIWHATDDPNVPAQSMGFRKRLSDQMHFFAETQQATYQELYDHYRSIGCQQLINASNWRTASASRLLDLERWSTLPNEVVALNRYYDPGHFGPNSGWRIERLHHYQGLSVMHQPHRLPINVKQLADRPFLITESGWNLPHKYQAEGPFLIAAYQSLTGVDGFYWFNPSATTYEDDPYWPYFGNVNGQEPMYRWTLSTPGQLGMFPANALAYRLGYIREGEPVVHEERTFESLVKMEVPLITEEKSFDPNRDTYTPDTGAGETALSPLTFLAGPVEVVYEGDPEKTTIAPQLDDLINLADKQLQSITGELHWDYGQGICTLDAPKVQGLCGFPKDQPYSLSDVTITSSNEYAVVNVVALDDQPLNISERILVQVGTVYQPTGWEEVATTFSPNNNATPIAGYRIEDLGSMPWKAANTEVSIQLKNPMIRSAIQINAAGYRDQAISLSSDGETASIDLPPSAMYVILESSPSSDRALPVPASALKLYPNPSTRGFRLEVGGAYQDLPIQRVELMSVSGKRLAAFPFEKGKRYKIDLPTGVYWVQLMNSRKVMGRQKLVVE